jgi:hypothetical protein
MDASPKYKTSILRCPSCGTLLAVSPDTERFGCKDCSAELIVVRHDATTALKRVAASV